jgi:hypothetical protein
MACSSFHLRRRNTQHRARRFVRLGRQTEIGAQIEQIVLNARQRGLDREIGRFACIAHREKREADRAIRLVDVAHGCDARVALRPPRPVPKPGLALVAGARIDDVQLDHAFPAADLSRSRGSRVARRGARVHCREASQLTLRSRPFQ